MPRTDPPLCKRKPQATNRLAATLNIALPTEAVGFDALAELALDMRWSWNHATDKVWRQLDTELWELTHNWIAAAKMPRMNQAAVIAGLLAIAVHDVNGFGMVQA